MAIPAGVLELKCWSNQPSQMKQLRSSSKNMHFKQGLLGREMFKPADRTLMNTDSDDFEFDFCFALDH
jgi:hypothetical protein